MQPVHALALLGLLIPSCHIHAFVVPGLTVSINHALKQSAVRTFADTTTFNLRDASR